MSRSRPETFTFSQQAVIGLRPRVPRDPIPADLGTGDAVSVHILPDVVAPEEVVFVAADYEMDKEGYWIDLQRLRAEDDWFMHLSEKTTRDGHTPAVVMLAEALARKFIEKGDPYNG